MKHRSLIPSLLALCAAGGLLGACASTGSGGGGSSAAAPDPGTVWSDRAYPTGRRRTSAVLVERGVPAEVQSGQKYAYEIRVTNLTDQRITNVTLQDTAPAGFAVPEGAPAAEHADGIARWSFPALAGGETVVVQGEGIAGAPGEFEQTCHVTWDAPLVAKTVFTLPKLSLTKDAPERVVLADGITYTYTIANEGTGTARAVKIEESLPEGVTTTAGENAVVLDVGPLAAGESRTFTVRCGVAGTGTYASAAKATAFGGLETATEPVGVEVTQPRLAVFCAAAPRAAIGQAFAQTITVKNDGDGPSRATTLSVNVPSSVAVVEASDDGKQTPGAVTWALGSVEPGAERSVTLRLRALTSGALQHIATVDGHGAETATSAEAMTELYGIATVTMEVSDTADPIEVGGEAVYVVSVVNQGTAPATNVRIACTLEDGMSYLNAMGATEANVDGGKVTFAAVDKLAPKARLVWKVVVAAKDAGDHRFHVALTADQIERPVEQAESTKFYK